MKPAIFFLLPVVSAQSWRFWWTSGEGVQAPPAERLDQQCNKLHNVHYFCGIMPGANGEPPSTAERKSFPIRRPDCVFADRAGLSSCTIKGRLGSVVCCPS
ncbi:hypothetical protein H9Q73_014274 [Fusarium xylarioides]|nr:hypothetical protein H9Q73_014274 [Fusarium xylarioides]